MLNSPPLWKFNPSICQSKQFPLYFTNSCVDTISKALTAFGSSQNERIIYMGPRYTSSCKLLKAYSHSESRTDNEINDSQLYGEEEINKYVYNCTERQRYYPVRSSQYRLFNGMNPTAKKSQLIFDSNFECGNLDLVVSLGKDEYDLFMKVDSNTKGHACWFFFKVSNFLDRQRVKFNIVNFSRSELLYDSGMKIFTYCSSLKQWVQEGQKLSFYRSEKCKYVQKQAAFDASSKLHTLSFQYEFKIEDEFVYFSYCVPYSYSYLEFTLKEVEKKYFRIADVDRSNLSTAGLQIPIVTITNKNSNLVNLEQESEEKKDVCLIIGRLHPGQTQGSWLLHGFINYLCSPKAKQLRNRVIFKIIPMVNVEGVVCGNFRTGLLGRDLNRHFHQPELINEIGLIRSIADKFKPFMFLDFHGHSSKKNVFTYGPDYAIDSRYFLPCRLFSKIISKCAKSFRYYACNFRILGDKKTTGRAIMLRKHQVTYCFTVQASAFAYGPKRDEVIYDKYQYMESGSSICMGVDKFIKIINTLPKRYEFQKELERKSQSFKKITLNNEDTNLSVEDKKLLQEIMNDEKEPFKFDKDNPGQEDSDFEKDNDYTQKELAKMLTDPIEITFFKKRKDNIRVNRKLLPNKSQQPRQNHSLSSQKSILVEGPKLTEPDEPIAQFPKRKIKFYKHLRHLSPELERNQSESMHLNVESFPHPPNVSINKIHLKLSSKIFSQDSCIILQDPLTKLQSLNQVSLDYSINKGSSEYSPFSQFKLKQKEVTQAKKRNKQKEKVQINSSLPSSKLQQQPRIEIKHALLPMLGRSGNMNKEQSNSLLEQILENHERSRNRASKHVKIFYY